MTSVPLSAVARVDSGAGFPIANQGAQGEEFPFLKVSDMNLPGNERQIVRWNNSVSDLVRKTLRAKAFPPGSVIFPKIGAAIGTNKKRQLTRPSCVDNNVMVVVPQAGLLDADYLYFAFRAKNISDFASASNPPSIRKPDVENWQVPLPPLPEQRRIVDLLARAEGIVRLRREAAAKAAELIPALFIHHFGDPAVNPMGWPVVPLGDGLRAADYGCSTKAYADGEGVPLIRMGNVTYAGDMDLSDLKFVQLDSAEQTKYELLAGDLLFNRTNSKELVGKTGLWAGQREAVVASYFIRLRVDPTRLVPTYLWAYMNSGFMKKVLFETARGAIGQANINSKELKAFPVPLPPTALQQLYAEKVTAIQSIVGQQTTALAKAQSTFDALLAQAFAPA